MLLNINLSNLKSHFRELFSLFVLLGSYLCAGEKDKGIF